MTTALTLADVLDLRAYERVREEYRAQVIARKRLRRVALGPIMTLVFECVDTVRFQVQEMARVEKIISDEAIQVELDIYNRLLPQVGELSATLFIELTSDGSLREWLPRLVGIETATRRRARRRRGAERARGGARGGADPRDGDAGRPLPPLRLHPGPGGGLRRRSTRSPWWPATRPTRPADGPVPTRCARNCSATCAAQQSRFPSADQGQFCAQVFTDAPDVGHTLRSPNSVPAPLGQAQLCPRPGRNAPIRLLRGSVSHESPPRGASKPPAGASTSRRSTRSPRTRPTRPRPRPSAPSARSVRLASSTPWPTASVRASGAARPSGSAGGSCGSAASPPDLSRTSSSSRSTSTWSS